MADGAAEGVAVAVGEAVVVKGGVKSGGGGGGAPAILPARASDGSAVATKRPSKVLRLGGGVPVRRAQAVAVPAVVTKVEAPASQPIDGGGVVAAAATTIDETTGSATTGVGGGAGVLRLKRTASVAGVDKDEGVATGAAGGVEGVAPACDADSRDSCGGVAGGGADDIGGGGEQDVLIAADCGGGGDGGDGVADADVVDSGRRVIVFNGKVFDYEDLTECYNACCADDDRVSGAVAATAVASAVAAPVGAFAKSPERTPPAAAVRVQQQQQYGVGGGGSLDDVFASLERQCRRGDVVGAYGDYLQRRWLRADHGAGLLPDDEGLGRYGVGEAVRVLPLDSTACGGGGGGGANAANAGADGRVSPYGGGGGSAYGGRSGGAAGDGGGALLRDYVPIFDFGATSFPARVWCRFERYSVVERDGFKQWFGSMLYVRLNDPALCGGGGAGGLRGSGRFAFFFTSFGGGPTVYIHPATGRLYLSKRSALRNDAD